MTKIAAVLFPAVSISDVMCVCVWHACVRACVRVCARVRLGMCVCVC